MASWPRLKSFPAKRPMSFLRWRKTNKLRSYSSPRAPSARGVRQHIVDRLKLTVRVNVMIPKGSQVDAKNSGDFRWNITVHFMVSRGKVDCRQARSHPYFLHPLHRVALPNPFFAVQRLARQWRELSPETSMTMCRCTGRVIRHPLPGKSDMDHIHVRTTLLR